MNIIYATFFESHAKSHSLKYSKWEIIRFEYESKMKHSNGHMFNNFNFLYRVQMHTYTLVFNISMWKDGKSHLSQKMKLMRKESRMWMNTRILYIWNWFTIQKTLFECSIVKWSLSLMRFSVNKCPSDCGHSHRNLLQKALPGTERNGMNFFFLFAYKHKNDRE